MTAGLTTPMRQRLREATLFGRLPTLETEREDGGVGVQSGVDLFDAIVVYCVLRDASWQDMVRIPR